MNMTDIEKTSLEYKFTLSEIKLLAKFFRKNQEKIPEGLETFCKVIEDTIYNSLSIEEVSQFYS